MTITTIIAQVYELTGWSIPILVFGVPFLYWIVRKAIREGFEKELVWILLILYFAGFAIFQTNPFFIGVVAVLIALPIIKAILKK